MSALDELAVQCERRGWRVALTTSHPLSDPAAVPARVQALQVRGRHLSGQPRELLASAVVEERDGELLLDAAALDCAQSLAAQGLINSEAA